MSRFISPSSLCLALRYVVFPPQFVHSLSVSLRSICLSFRVDFNETKASVPSLIRRMKNQASKKRLPSRARPHLFLFVPLFLLQSVDSVGVGRSGVGGGVLMAAPLLPSLAVGGGSPPFCCLRGFPTSISGTARPRPPATTPKEGRWSGINSCCLRRCHSHSSHHFKSVQPFTSLGHRFPL